ncbi:MAG: hypothetical protein JSS97_12545 [Actinobacteria bacterium]|nr:hypothetical protein [Actinomycetota bacterium]
MTAKEKLLREILALDDADAERAHIVIAEEAEIAPLPSGWRETVTGEPMPDVAGAARRSRESH